MPARPVPQRLAPRPPAESAAQLAADGIRAVVDRVLAWDLAGPAADLPDTDVAADLLDQLTAHARNLAARLEFDYRTLPPASQTRPTATAVLGEASRRLDQRPPVHATRAVARRAQNIARLVRALARAADAVRSETATPQKGTR
ncbi:MULTISPECIES: DUF6415 family natural product biosynthesis protein [unclassified Streptomyces]|uniref:DUF6415 family natural product biosynthesis protein n=1 Tax=unclassified Streptomyces TaxID=2593676 RepID=UPI0036E1301B